MPKGSNKAQSDCVIAVRRQAVLEARLAGKTLRAIAGELGISKTQAGRDIQNVLAELDDDITAQATVLRNLEHARLERLLSAVWPKAIAGDIRANDRAHKVIEAQCRLHGLFAPVKVAQTLPDGSPAGCGLHALLMEGEL